MFVEQLGPSFDLSQMLVVNLMHELELGIWKALFVHMICILYAAAPSGRLVALLDERFAHFSLAMRIATWLTINTSTDIAKHPHSVTLSGNSQTMFLK